MMNGVPLKFLSEDRVRELYSAVPDNHERYLREGFFDLARENGWAIEATTVTVKHDVLEMLDAGVTGMEGEVRNSLLMYEALEGMTPALAREERVWVRLTHVECIEFSRQRWLEGKTGEKLDHAIRTHFFAPTLTGVRDDNAAGRLWWNAQIAHMADPQDPEGALRLMLKIADIRLNLIERTGISARRCLLQAIIRALREDKWLTSSQEHFRDFMWTLNRDGSGVLFETLTADDVSEFVDDVAKRARNASRRVSKAR